MYQAQTPPSKDPKAAADPRGPLVLQNLEPGSYAVQPQLGPPWYVASASCGNVDLVREPLVLAAGSAACVMRLVLRDDCGSLTYSVTAKDTNGPELRAFVAAIPLGTRIQTVEERFMSGQAANQGSFPCLAPGHYLVVAADKRQELPYRDNDAMRSFLSLGEEVTITRNGKADVQLKLITGEP